MPSEAQSNSVRPSRICTAASKVSDPNNDVDPALSAHQKARDELLCQDTPQEPLVLLKSLEPAAVAALTAARPPLEVAGFIGDPPNSDAGDDNEELVIISHSSKLLDLNDKLTTTHTHFLIRKLETPVKHCFE